MIDQFPVEFSILQITQVSCKNDVCHEEKIGLYIRTI